jgi:competence CoiA-like predicted nuclease
MQYALVNDEKVEATPQSTGKCQLCDKNVFSRCGEINIWHWSHYKSKICDGWHEPETEWHRNWKSIFGKENSEVVIQHDGIKHIADILTNNKVVIELQNSPIQSQVIRKREDFYGERMFWILNGSPFEENITISSDGLLTSLVQTQEGWRIIHAGQKVHNTKNEQEYKEIFIWSYPRKSWSVVQRNLFIDFGGPDLFWVKSGMGTRYGHGNYVSKKRFIEKYGGDLSILSKVILRKENKHSNFPRY